MKIFQLIAALVLMSPNSCEVEEPFDAADGRRSFVSGRIVDQQGNGIEDTGVQIRSYDDLLSITLTDSNGNFETAIIEPINGIRKLTASTYQADLTLTNFDIEYNFEDPESVKLFDIGTIALKQRAVVKVTIENSAAVSIINRVSYSSATCHYHYVNDILVHDECYRVVEETQYSNFNRTYQVPIDTSFTVTIIQNGVETDYDYFINTENYEISITI